MHDHSLPSPRTVPHVVYSPVRYLRLESSDDQVSPQTSTQCSVRSVQDSTVRSKISKPTARRDRSRIKVRGLGQHASFSLHHAYSPLSVSIESRTLPDVCTYSPSSEDTTPYCMFHPDCIASFDQLRSPFPGSAQVRYHTGTAGVHTTYLSQISPALRCATQLSVLNGVTPGDLQSHPVPRRDL